MNVQNALDKCHKLDPLLELDENEFWLIFYVKQFVVYTIGLDLFREKGNKINNHG
jgi:hypothetical protein